VEAVAPAVMEAVAVLLEAQVAADLILLVDLCQILAQEQLVKVMPVVRELVVTEQEAVVEPVV
jgi:hypothetical protein